MFTLSTGSFQQIEEKFLADFAAQRSSDPLADILILSPSGRLLTHLQSRLAQASPGYLNIHFLTFYALAERLLADSHYFERQVNEPAFFNEMIHRILAGESDEPLDREVEKLFGLTGRRVPKGLPAALAGTLKDLRDSGIRAKAALLADKEGLLKGATPVETATLALHARLTGLFQTHQIRTSADLLRRAAEAAPSHPWLARQKMICLYGFYDLTGVQLDFVGSLSHHPNARVYFPYQKNNPAYAYAERLLKDPAFTSKIAEKRDVEDSQAPSPRTETWSCSGARDEAWLAAKEILRLSDEGLSFDDIGIASRNLSPYLSALREIFATHRIPYRASRGENAGSHPLVKAVRALLTLYTQHARISTVQKDLENSPYIDSAPKAEVMPEANGAWSSHVAWAMDQMNRHVKLPADASREETILLANITSTFQDLLILDTLGAPVSRRRFLEVWDEKLKLLERPSATEPHGGVQVLEVQEARGLSFKALFILGINEKVFPRLIREDPFLSDAVRDALSQATGSRLARKMNGYEEERLLFELMRSLPSQRLYLLTQRSDEEGKILIPSVYLQELKRSAPGNDADRLPRGTAEKLVHAPFNQPLTWTPKEFSFLANREKVYPEALYKALGLNTADFHRLLLSHNALEDVRPGIGPYDGQIKDETITRAALQHGFSPTGLEDLAECPFQFYAGRILRITPKEEFAPRGEMTTQALGILFHSTLEAFYNGCREKGLLDTSQGLPKRLSEAVTAAFDKHQDELSNVYPVALKSSKDIIFQFLSEFLEDEIEEFSSTGFRPTWFEQSLQGPIPQWSFPGVGDYRGQPDRIDVKEENGVTHVRVVDYKSGKPRTYSGTIETGLIKGKYLQLPVYLALASSFAEKTLGKKVISAQAVLRQIRTPGENERPLTSAFWEKPSAQVLAENIQELIGLVEKGWFYIEPSSNDEGYCKHCHFSRVCRKEHMPTRLRAERDATRQRVSEKLDRSAPRTEAPEKTRKRKGKTTDVS